MPMKMEPIVSSETSAIRTQTAGNFPKRNKFHSDIKLVSYSSTITMMHGPIYSRLI